MAGSVNKVIIVGNLGRDPEVRTTNSGGKVVSLSVATSESWRDQNGDQQERTEWHRIVIFNERLGAIAEKHLEKGSTIYIEGQLQTRKWQDQSGQDRYTTEIVLGRYRGEMTMLGSRPGGNNRSRDTQSGREAASSGSSQQTPSGNDGFGSGGGGLDLDDDIPF